MSLGVAPEISTILSDSSGALGTREHDQDLEISALAISGKLIFTLVGLAGHFRSSQLTVSLVPGLAVLSGKVRCHCSALFLNDCKSNVQSATNGELFTFK